MDMDKGNHVELYSTMTKGYTIKVMHEVRPEGISSGIIHLAVIKDSLKGFLWGYFESITPSIIEDHLIRLLGYDCGIDDDEIAQMASEIDARITAEKESRTPSKK